MPRRAACCCVRMSWKWCWSRGWPCAFSDMVVLVDVAVLGATVNFGLQLGLVAFGVVVVGRVVEHLHLVEVVLRRGRRRIPLVAARAPRVASHLLAVDEGDDQVDEDDEE